MPRLMFLSRVRGGVRAFRERPVALLVVVIAGLSLVAGAFVVGQMREQMTAEADSRLARHAVDQAAAIDGVLSAATRDLRLANRNAVFRTALRGTAESLDASDRALVEDAIRYTGQRYGVDEICLIRADGRELARYNNGAIAAVDDLSPDESIGNPAFAPGIRLPDDEVFRTDPYISPDSGRWVFGLATPSYENGRVLGILHFELPLSAFSEALAVGAVSPSGYSFLLGLDGRLLDHPAIASFRTAAGLPTDPATAEFPPAISTGGADWRAGIGAIMGGSGEGRIRFAGVDLAYVSRPILGGDAVAVTVSPTAELYADVDRAQLNLVVTIGPLAALIVLLTAWFTRRLLRSNKKLAEAMHASAELASIVATADDAILSIDRDGRVVTWNDGAVRTFGIASDEVVGSPAIDLFPAERRDEAQLHLNAVMRGESVDRFETVMRCANGESVDALLTFSPVRAPNGELAGMSVIARDISTRKRLEEQLEHQALHDSLTGLPNRALFRDRLHHAVARLRRPAQTPPTDVVTGVLFIDLDDFKIINDTLGHRIGDELLVEVGRRINQSIRPGDTAARLGGDEFTVLLEDVANPSEARLVADRILDRLAAPYQLDGHDVVIGASIGIVLGDREAADPDELLRCADTALYEAKAKGKGQHATFHIEMGKRAWHRLELEAELRRAITENQFVVHYQPIIDLVSGEMVEVEALVRWEHPDRGMIPPNDFIPLAEETGLILPIGDFVRATAARDVATLRATRADFGGLGVSVNISPRELRRPDLVEAIVAACGTAGLALSDLRVEITEGLQLDDPASIRRLANLRTRGVKVSIDDFGTGYSSLASFRTMAIDGLKLDRVFVAAVGEAREETAIVTAAIGFGAALGIEVTGEGIETAAQLETLRGLGCGFGQGYLFARPMSVDGISRLPAFVPLPATPSMTRGRRRPAA